MYRYSSKMSSEGPAYKKSKEAAIEVELGDDGDLLCESTCVSRCNKPEEKRYKTVARQRMKLRGRIQW